MKKFSKWIILAFFITILAACGVNGGNETEKTSGKASDEPKEKPVLKMATSADFFPFESYDEEGNFIGFDIELAQIIADELGYELKIEDMGFDSLIGSLQAERVNMVMAGMSATEDRRKNVDFSTEYHRSGEMFLSLTDAPVETLEALEGKVVGVQLGTIQEEGADELKEEYGFEVKKLDDATMIVQELLTGRIDVAYMDKQVATGYAEQHGLVGFDDPTTVSPGMAIAFPKGSELVEEVDTILADLKASGKLKELKDKWELEQQD